MDGEESMTKEGTSISVNHLSKSFGNTNVLKKLI